MLGSIAAKLAFKTAGAAGSALAGAAGAVVKTGQAFGMAGKAIAGAAQNSSKQPQQSSNNVIVGNFGMAGSAGKQKVTGGGTLPAPKAVAKPQASTKMPTEALLDTAVKYLTSIDKSLKSQLEFERRSYQEQARAEREAIIENKPSVTFSDIKDRLSGFKSDVKDNVSTAGTLLKYAAILGGAAALIASALDQKELNALKENVEQFKKQFGWLGDLASMIPAGGIAGFLFGGKGLKGRLRGGVVGILAEAVATTIFKRMTGQSTTNSSGQEDSTGQEDNTALNLAAVGGIGYLGYRGAKSGISTFGKIKDARTKMANLRASKSYYDPNVGRMRSAAVGKAGQFVNTKGATGFLKSPRWQKFLNWLTKNGKRKLVTKIQQRIAIAVTSGAIASTGIGAVFGAIGFLLNLGFSLYFMYEIYELWQQFTSDENAEKAGVGNAQIEKELKTPDATKLTAGAGGTDATPGSTGKSLGKVTPEMLSKTPQQLTDDELRTIVEAQGKIEDPRGVTNNPGGILYGTGPLKDHQVGSVGANADSSVRIAKYDTAESGIQAAMINWKSSRYAGKSIRDSLGMWSGGNGAKYESMLTGMPAQYTGSGTTLTGAMTGMVNDGLEGMANLFGRLGSSIVKPGVARNFTPSGSNPSEQINNESMKLQNDITFGIKKEKSKDKITMPTIPAGTPRGVSPVKSVSNIDPNYQNINVVTKYLAHFRMAQ